MSRRVLGSACLIMLIGCDDTASTPTTPTATPPSASVDRANAADDYIAALMIVKSKTKYVEVDISRAIAKGLEKAPHSVHVSLKQCAPAMQRLTAAAKHSRCDWPEFKMREKFSRFGTSFTDMARVALLTTEQRLGEHKDSEAAALFDAMLRYVERLSADEGIELLFCRSAIRDCVHRWLLLPEFSTAFWNSIIDGLARLESWSIATRIFEADRRMAETLFDDLAALRGSALSNEGELPDEVAQWPLDHDRIKTRLRVPFDERIRRSRLPYAEAKALPPIELPDESKMRTVYEDLILRGKEGTLPPPEEGGKIMSDLLADVILKMSFGIKTKARPLLVGALDRCDFRAALVLIALRTHAAQNGSFPDDLSGVRSEWRIDPIGGQLFVYRKEKDGIILYGFGENLKDDGGDEGKHRGTGLDIVYRLKNR